MNSISKGRGPCLLLSIQSDSKCSIPHNKSIEALCVRVLVPNHASLGASVLSRPPLDLEERLQVLEQSHLLRIGHGIVLDVLLVRLQVVQDVVLLPQLGVEEVG